MSLLSTVTSGLHHSCLLLTHVTAVCISSCHYCDWDCSILFTTYSLPPCQAPVFSFPTDICVRSLPSTYLHILPFPKPSSNHLYRLEYDWKPTAVTVIWSGSLYIAFQYGGINAQLIIDFNKPSKADRLPKSTNLSMNLRNAIHQELPSR